MSNIFQSTPIEGGHSWTIISKLGDILKLAEEKYGSRDKSYTILGIELTTNNKPCIWYPKNCGNIIIHITSECINDIDRAVYQVAHEAIHCLSPTGTNSANILEEGLATYFSCHYSKINGHRITEPNDKKYRKAKELVGELLAIDSKLIKSIRNNCPTISKIDKNLLVKHNSQISERLAEKLTQKF